MLWSTLLSYGMSGEHVREVELVGAAEEWID